MTLLDFPGRVACTVFLGGCDFRCPFCHNYELVDGSAPAVMEESELFAVLEKRRGLLDGVAITGGEPCLRPELPEFMARIRAMGYAVKLDTNGSHPARLREILDRRLAEKIRELGYPLKLDTNGTHPEGLRRMIDAGLVAYAALDIKNDPDRYAQTCGMEQMDLGPVRESVRLLMEGRTEYEFRTTVVAELHDADSFRKIGEWIRGAKRYYLQKFTDRDTVAFAGFHAPDEEEMRAWLAVAREYVPGAELRGAE